MKRAGVFLRTLPRLGVANLARVLYYRLGVRAGLNPVRRLSASVARGPFFRSESSVRRGEGGVRFRAFGWYSVEISPGGFDWHANVLTGRRVEGGERPWWEIPDFGTGAGDIKAVWEASRFGWVVQLADEAASGSPEAVPRLNRLIDDWCAENPPYLGPNWKCGQETSIRVLHLAVAARMLGQELGPEGPLLDLIRTHCRRIVPTMMYAVAQDNNHGTSEAAALFVGGAWLAKVLGDAEGARWMRMGRRWLENRARRLISPDGSFSQYSVNYHRLMLDTFSIVEVWRRALGLREFSAGLRERVGTAARWLHAFVEPQSGDTPNIGANDGAWLMALASAEYRDFRPSVALAGALFLGEVGPDGPAARALMDRLGVERPDARLPEPRSGLFEHGGYAVLRRGGAAVFVRYPRYRFRPGHADALHVDFWLGGVNWLRDGGTYSYADPDCLSYFSGTASHNTVQFDDVDQMPRLGRFLFGDWLRAFGVSRVAEEGEAVCFSAGYRNREGHTHQRAVALSRGCLRILDDVAGFRKEAVLRWRLAPGAWEWDGGTLRGAGVRIRVVSHGPPLSVRLEKGWESRFYLRKDEVPVLEARISSGGRIETIVEWSA